MNFSRFSLSEAAFGKIWHRLLATWFFAASMIISASPAASQDTWDLAATPPGPGTRLWYREDEEIVIVDQTLLEASSGRQIRKTVDGNTLSNGSTVFQPHSGYLPPDAGGQLSQGMEWTHRYKANDVARTRRCKVQGQETLVIKAGTFRNVWRVFCINKRDDRPRGMEETIWFAPGLFSELKYIAYWSGGMRQYELQRFEPAQ